MLRLQRRQRLRLRASHRSAPQQQRRLSRGSRLAIAATTCSDSDGQHHDSSHRPHRTRCDGSSPVLLTLARPRWNVRRGRRMRDDARRDDEERQLLFALFDEAPVFMTYLEGPELRCTRATGAFAKSMDERRCSARPRASCSPGRSGHAGDRRAGVRDRRGRDGPRDAAVCRATRTRIAVLHAQLRADPRRRRHRARRPERDQRGHRGGARAHRARGDEQKRSQAELQRMFALLEEAPVMLAVVEGSRLARHDGQSASARAVRRASAARHAASRHGPADNPTLAAIDRVYASGRSETYEVVVPLPGIAGRSFNIDARSESAMPTERRRRRHGRRRRDDRAAPSARGARDAGTRPRARAQRGRRGGPREGSVPRDARPRAPQSARADAHRRRR